MNLPPETSEYILRVSPTVDPKEIIGEIARQMRMRPADITGRKQQPEYVNARSAVALTLRSFGWSYPRIGKVLGNRDHTTVINLIERIGKAGASRK